MGDREGQGAVRLVVVHTTQPLGSPQRWEGAVGVGEQQPGGDRARGLPRVVDPADPLGQPGRGDAEDPEGALGHVKVLGDGQLKVLALVGIS